MVQKQLIYNPFTEKETKIDPYGRTAKKIYKYLIEEEGNFPENILPTDLTLVNGRFKKVKTSVDFSNVKRITYAQLPRDEDGNVQPYSYFYELFKQYKGKTIRIEVKYSNAFDADEDSIVMTTMGDTTEVPAKKGFTTWWNNTSRAMLMIDSDTSVFGSWNEKLQPNLQSQLLILTADKVDAENVQQYFLDGITHCVFTPINEWAIVCEDNAKSKSAKGRYKKIQKNIKKYLDIYEKGVPEQDLPEICNKLQIGIEIDVPSTLNNDTKYIEYESQKKPLKKFKFINTRLNHIELNEVSNKSDYEECSGKDLLDIFNEKSVKKEFMMWKESKNGIVQINTTDKVYKLTDKEGYSAAVSEFENDNNLFDYKIEHFSNEKLSDWLLDNVHTNGSINLREAVEDFENYTNLNHIDIRKAYTRGSECSYYKGYLGKITDFRSCDDIVGLGIYQIKNIKYNGNILVERMKILYEGSAYPSPELEYYRSIGITFDIDCGCWGSEIDIDFGDDWGGGMFEKEGGVSHYSKWFGCSMKLTTKDRYNFDCKDINFAGLNQYCNDDVNIRWNYQSEYGIIEYQKKKAYHQAHIASFITSYCRISMMEQLHKFSDIDNIICVVVDGIYYKGDVEVGKLFSDKEQKSFNMVDDEYLTNTYGYINPDELPKYRENNRVELHKGEGGCGKTHYNLTDKGLVDIMFVAPSWKLARNKKREFGVDSTTFFHLLDSDPDNWEPISKFYSTLIIDEVSMLSNEAKEKIINRFDTHKIIFCGDIGFQLPPIEGSLFKPGNIPVIEHNTNYRCKCKKLYKILKFLRKHLAEGVDSFSSELDEYFGIKVIDKDSINYSVEDLIITSTHKNKDRYTAKYAPCKELDNMINSLENKLNNNKLKPKEIKDINDSITLFKNYRKIPYKLELEKYSVLENTRDYSNGDIIIGPKPKKVRCEPRHAFTIHSIQGETAENKLFIDMNKMRDLKMFYTALSRANYIEQIILMR